MGGQSVQIKVTGSRGGISVVQLDGVLDRNSVPDIRKKLIKLARNREVSKLELDFSRVASIDTAGVALLVEIMKYLSFKRGRVQLREANEQVQRMIRLARLDSIFEMKVHTDDEI